MRRHTLLALLLLLFVPAAGAWTWPVEGPVLQTFSFDRAHPYAAGQHRGIAIGAGDGTPVRAPASGVVTFAGTVPTNGKTITIETTSGLAVSLTHLGSIMVARNASVDEGTAVGTVGASGTPEFDVPYVHLGVREAANDQGYLDPLAFLPAPAPPLAVPVPAPPVAVPAAAPILAAPQPVEVPAVPVVPPAPVVEAPSAPAVPAAPPVESPVAVSSAPAEPAPAQVPVAPTAAEVPVAPTPALSPVPVAVGPPQMSPAFRAGAGRSSAAPTAVHRALWRVRAGADSFSAVSPAFQALHLRGIGHVATASLAPGPLPSVRPFRSTPSVPPSHDVRRVVPLALPALLVLATLVVLVWSRRRRPPGTLLRLRAVASPGRGRLAA